MKEVLLSFITGTACGLAFGALKLPIPAPPVLSGVVGIVGIFVGYAIINRLVH